MRIKIVRIYHQGTEYNRYCISYIGHSIAVKRSIFDHPSKQEGPAVIERGLTEDLRVLSTTFSRQFKVVDPTFKMFLKSAIRCSLGVNSLVFMSRQELIKLTTLLRILVKNSDNLISNDELDRIWLEITSCLNTLNVFQFGPLIFYNHKVISTRSSQDMRPTLILDESKLDGRQYFKYNKAPYYFSRRAFSVNLGFPVTTQKNVKTSPRLTFPLTFKFNNCPELIGAKLAVAVWVQHYENRYGNLKSYVFKEAMRNSIS